MTNFSKTKVFLKRLPKMSEFYPNLNVGFEDKDVERKVYGFT